MKPAPAPRAKTRLSIKEINEFSRKLKKKRVVLNVSTEAVEWFVKEGYSDEFGARNISRLIQDQMKDFFVDEILFGRLSSGGSASVMVKEGKIVLEAEAPATV